MSQKQSASPTPARSERLTAAKILARWFQNSVVPWNMRDEATCGKPVVTELVAGVIRWQRWYLHIVSEFAEKQPPLRLMPFLLLGLHQILTMDSIPPFAAVNETVTAAREAGTPDRLISFLNAMLRRAAKNTQALQAARFSLPPAVAESHPDTLYERWSARYGKEAALALCRWNNSRPQLVVQVRQHIISLDEFVSVLSKQGIRAFRHPFDPARFVVVESGIPPRQLPGFSTGALYIQDPSTAIAVNMLNPGPADVVLDACAAPGGKTALIADATVGGKGHVFAVDISPARLKKIEENIRRLCLKNVSVFMADSTCSAAIVRVTGRQHFDRILVDAPCTSTGVIRRRPDAKWRFSMQRLKKSVRKQKELLEAAVKLLKEGGRLVYSTCSLESEENEELVRDFVTAHPDVRVIEERNIFPPASSTDGAYAALLEKKG